MSIQNPISLLVLDEVDASVSQCSEAQPLCFNYDWFLHVIKTGADGNPFMKIQVSNDLNWEWVDYTCSATDIELTQTAQGYKDDSFTPNYFRICLEPNGTTTGTVSARINLKPR